MSRYLIFLLAALLCLAAGVANGIMDTGAFHYAASKMWYWDSAYWDLSVSWCNKWAACQPGYEAFPYSSTVLVSLTDGWHFMKLLYSTLSLMGVLLFGYGIVSGEKKSWQASRVRSFVMAFCLPVLLAKVLVGIGFYITYDLWLPLTHLHGL